MDPYLERHWRSVHAMLIVYACSQLQSQLGESLVARPEERLIVEEPSGGRAIYPDVRIVEYSKEPGRVPGLVDIGSGATAVAEPVVLHRDVDPAVERFIEIFDPASGGRVVTVVEFLSPGNKLPGDGLRKYARKQQECYDAGVNLVEIDLTRAGQRNLLVHRYWTMPPQLETAYAASIWRAAMPSQCELFPIKLEQRLPVIGIPLRTNDLDASLDLQYLVNDTYRNGRHDITARYNQPCEPPLLGANAEFSKKVLAARQ